MLTRGTILYTTFSKRVNGGPCYHGGGRIRKEFDTRKTVKNYQTGYYGVL